MLAADFDRVEFARLQAQLLPMWPAMTLRKRDEERTLVIVSSVSLPVPDHLAPLFPAYEERYLFHVMVSAKGVNSRAIYVTSQPLNPRLLDYYLALLPGHDRAELGSRIVSMSVSDWSPRPLTEKVLERPRFIERIRRLIPHPDRAVLMPFVTTPLEARLAVELGIPVYGPHPDLAHLGTKTGSRAVFSASGVPHPRGAEGVRTVDDVVEALETLLADDPPDEAVLKLDNAVSGLGNAIIDLRNATERTELRRRVLAAQPEDATLGPSAFLEQLETAGGVIEERIAGDDFCSPSAQLRASPEGGVEMLSTHDQMLGGPSGQTYFGCRFPADPGYAHQLTDHALVIGDELSRRGVIGRFAIDFVAVRRNGVWHDYAVEINLRNGGTTHPALALLALTEGMYDTESAQWLARGKAKHYVATDHLELPGLSTLTPDDVLDILEERGLVWDTETLTGPVLHMLSAVAVAGRLGLTAIGDSPDEATAVYDNVTATLEDAIRS